MAWEIRYSDTSLKQLRKLDKGVAKEILDYFDKKIAVLEDPRTIGKGLTGVLATYWRYRVGNMRIISHIDTGEVTVLVLRIGHRSKVYDDEKKTAAKAIEDVEAFRQTKKEEREKAEKDAADLSISPDS